MARILIVDDDTAFRESLAEMLGDLGHGVSQAPTVAAGLQILRLCKGAECGGAALLVAFGAPRAA